jgi:hypothetical protein
MSKNRQASQAEESWCRRYGDSYVVVEWVRKNPPPKRWMRSKAAWAWLHMPLGLELGYFGVD